LAVPHCVNMRENEAVRWSFSLTEDE
jgi:hypothetical protein